MDVDGCHGCFMVSNLVLACLIHILYPAHVNTVFLGTYRDFFGNMPRKFGGPNTQKRGM